jgi:membrane-associated protease RseP (regulator of RpoE activity)
VPVVAAIGLFLILSSLFALLWNPALGEVARQGGLGQYLLIPGLNPYLPIVYGLFAIFVAIVVHEGAHGVAARSLGLPVKSSGLVFLLILPIGAFVDVDEDAIKKANAKTSSRVFAAGVGSNIVVAVVCLIAVLAVCSSLTPIINGVVIAEVTPGLPAEAAGLLANDVFVTVDGVPIYRMSDLNATLANKTAGDMVPVTVARGYMWQNTFSTVVTLADNGNRTVMGISGFNLLTEERLSNYVTIDSARKLSMYMVPPAVAPGLVPFSNSLAAFYSSPLGPRWAAIANTFFWLWFINVNLAIFNALPLYPLDGGRMFNIALKSAIRDENRQKLVSQITIGVTLAIVTVLLLTILLPFLM